MRCSLSSLPWLLALALPVSAQSLSCGLSVGAVGATGDLHAFDRDPGGYLGGFLDVDCGGGQVFRPRLDVAYLPPKTGDEGGTSYKRDFYAGSVSLDYDCYLSGARTGLYGQVGAGLYRMVAKTNSDAGGIQEKTTQFGGSIGAGYDFNTAWGVSFRYAYSTFKSGLPDQQSIPNPTAGMVILAANHRF